MNEDMGGERPGPLARLRRRWSRWDTALLLGSLALLAGAGLPLPGYTIGPGPTRAVDELVEVAEGEAFPPRGEVLLATVALHPLSPFRAVQAWLDTDINTVAAEDVVGSEARAQDMQESRTVAVTVALQRLGLPPSAGDEGGLVGIKATGVDGNSAGLAFTLAILDVLTPGELTAGLTIGVTGTIEADGDVGPVGSVGLKAVAMSEVGADYLLVPAGQGAEATAQADDSLEIIEVATLEEALTALEGLGGQGLAQERD
ncbi:MAG: S16 family serine protease [Acidimicrobiales bacterium]